MGRREPTAHEVHLARAVQAFQQMLDTIPTALNPNRDMGAAEEYSETVSRELALARAARLVEEDARAQGGSRGAQGVARGIQGLG